jgi:putative hydrolase of the HAD superfamily
LDADGVLQHRPGGWEDAFVDFVGTERAAAMLADMFEAEKPAIRGDADVIGIIASVLARYGSDADPEHVYDTVWRRIDVPEQSRDLVRRLRAAGLGVHLGTNQTRQRAAYMRTTLGYDELFDVSVYSAELGVSKPADAYFRTAVERIGARADEVLFVDDTRPNVEAAARVGLAAVHWHMDEGMDALVERLAEHGVLLVTGGPRHA